MAREGHSAENVQTHVRPYLIYSVFSACHLCNIYGHVIYRTTIYCGLECFCTKCVRGLTAINSTFFVSSEINSPYFSITLNSLVPSLLSMSRPALDAHREITLRGLSIVFCGLFLHFLKDHLAVGFQDSQEFVLCHFLMLLRLPAEKIVGINTVVFRQPLYRRNRGVGCSALVLADHRFGHIYRHSHLALSNLFLRYEFNQSASCYGRRLFFYAP